MTSSTAAFTSKHLPTRAAAYVAAFKGITDTSEAKAFAHHAVWAIGGNPAFPRDVTQRLSILRVAGGDASRLAEAAAKYSSALETVDADELAELEREQSEHEWVASEC